MSTSSKDEACAIFPLCRSLVGGERWKTLLAMSGNSTTAESFVDMFSSQVENLGLPPFLSQLAKLEWTKHVVERSTIEIPKEATQFKLNPTLEVLDLSWKLTPFLNGIEDITCVQPSPEKEWAIIWQNPKDRKVLVEPASNEELLAIKVLAEDMTPEDAADAGEIPVGAIDRAILAAVENGLVLAPRSRIRRNEMFLPAGTPECFITAKTFTLQWHITNVCDLSCKHCYDRTKRSPLTLEQGKRVLRDFREFCRERHVRGNVCFTGGNPFLYPEFFSLYEATSAMGFSTAILGNPVPRSKIERLVAIQRPGYFQVSLEGEPSHNDDIRGRGFYLRVIEFLGMLRDMDVSSAVMLTLTKDNIDQVLPLAERLRGHAEYFTFNRLSCVGSGANLSLPTRERYIAFLHAFVDAAQANPIIGFKDNLINIVLHQMGKELFDGCTGFGCGAAFNFLAILPDGEAHACRKFPSPLGNVFHKTITEIYDSETAERFRRGCRACDGCALKAVCGSCLSIASSHGLDMFEQQDPYCFMKST